jgi:hypothetical protein
MDRRRQIIVISVARAVASASVIGIVASAVATDAGASRGRRFCGDAAKCSILQ